ncbi:MAG: ABC transporter permease [Chromatiales bacterium]|jgi:peptide/nickel transport system permease protein|nr:ABC transporter permease [Chromatiales bacterium]
MSELQLRSRKRIDTLGADETPWRVRMRRLSASAGVGLSEIRKSRTASLGAMMIIFLAAVCALTPVLSTHNPTKTDYRVRLAPMSAEHYFGTDKFGRDIYSRVLHGARRTVGISVAAVAFGLIFGIPFGILSGYFGGRVDAISMRVVDGLLAFPGLLLYLLIVTVAREYKLVGFWNDLILVFALGFAFIPEVARLARSAALVESSKEYVEASHIIGEGPFRTAMGQVLPNCVSPLIVNATVRLGFMILIIAALSFLGLGTPPPTPDWGADLSAARSHMESHPMIAVFPGVAICFSVLAFNLFGDGLRDILDPRSVDR